MKHLYYSKSCDQEGDDTCEALCKLRLSYDASYSNISYSVDILLFPSYEYIYNLACHKETMPSKFFAGGTLQCRWKRAPFRHKLQSSSVHLKTSHAIYIIHTQYISKIILNEDAQEQWLHQMKSRSCHNDSHT